jgi:hypothetical protein
MTTDRDRLLSKNRPSNNGAIAHIGYTFRC